MSKEIICVYQDCPLCGDRGKKLKELIFEKKLNVRKVSFASPEGKELSYKAVFENGVKKMPFFTDGERFVEDIKELTEKPVEKPKKTTKKKKTKKVKQMKGVDNGDLG